MVAVIVDDGDAVPGSGAGEAPAHASELSERFLDAGVVDAEFVRNRDRRGGVEGVVPAWHRQRYFRDLANGLPGAITVLAASERGGLLHAPDCYMEKMVVGPSCKGMVDLEAPVGHNLAVIAKVLGRRVEDLVIVILDRPRHEKLIADVRKAGARIRLISDGDLSPGVAAAMLGSGVHAVMGAGGAPEGVITAAAIRCLNGYMVGRLTGYTPQQAERMSDMGIKDPKRIYIAEELAPGKNIVFAATGVTDGPLLKGVRFFGDGVRTTSLVMKLTNRKVRFIESIHVSRSPDAKVRIP